MLHSVLQKKGGIEGNEVSTTSRVAGGSAPEQDRWGKTEPLRVIAAPSTSHPLPRGGTDLIDSQYLDSQSAFLSQQHASGALLGIREWGNSVLVETLIR